MRTLRNVGATHGGQPREGFTLSSARCPFHSAGILGDVKNEGDGISALLHKQP